MLTLSIGNSNLRYALFDDATITHRGVLPLDEDIDLSLIPLEKTEARPCVLTSVRPDWDSKIQSFLKASGVACSQLGKDFSLSLPNAYHDTSEVGTDRLLGILSALNQFPDQAVVTVDFGTAITINVGSSKGEFLGGLIFMGASTQGQLINEWTPRLPQVDPEAIADGFIARSTEEALKAGIFWQVAGGIESILKNIQSQLGEEIKVVATGGDVDKFASKISLVDSVDSELVLKGLRLCYLHSQSKH